MRILHLNIRGFGELRGDFPLDAGEGRLGLLLEKNEAGKTTLVEAILAALYGLDKDKRKSRGKLSEWEQFRPWDGGPYGVILHLRHGGEDLTIERDFNDDSVRVLSAGSDCSDRYRSGKRVAVGEKMLGLRREQFLNSAFVRQGEVGWGDASALSEALQRVADATPGETTSAQAIELLRRGLEEYEGLTLAGKGKVETEIQRCRQRIEETKKELDVLREEKEKLGRRIDQLRRSEDRKAQREKKRKSIELARVLLSLEELEAELQAGERQRALVVELEEKIRGDENLLAIGEDDLESAEKLYQRWVGARKTAESYLKDAGIAEGEKAEALAKVEVLGLQRPPVAEDLEAMIEAQARIADAQSDRKRLEENAHREEEAIGSAGFDSAQAEALLAGFSYLTAEDRELLESRTKESFSIEDHRTRLREELSSLRARQDEIGNARVHRRRWGGIVAAIGAAIFASGLLWPLALGLAGHLLSYAGGVVLVVGLYFFVSATRWRNTEESLAAAQVERCAGEIHEIEERNQEHEVAWQDLAHRLGIPTEELERYYRRLKDVKVNLEALAGIAKRMEDAGKQEEAALESVAKAWEVFDDEPSAELIPQRLAALREATNLYRAVEAATKQAESQTVFADEKKLAWIQRRRELREAMQRCGIVLGEKATVEEIEEAYRELKKRRESIREARHRRDEELPKARALLLDENTRRTKEVHQKELQQEIERRTEEGITPEAIPVDLLLSRRREHLDRLADELSQQERSDADDREHSLTEVRSFLQRYEDRVPQLWEKLEELKRALRRAREFRDAVSLAMESLEEISRESYRDWAEGMNREASRLLEKLGTESRQLRFSEDLGFQLSHRGKLLSDREVDQQLSTGARDGVYLAARLAVSRLLGGKESLPLILDDPFAHCDDDRLLEGLSMLFAAAEGQQVLLLACQRSRYQWALEELDRPGALVILALGEP